MHDHVKLSYYTLTDCSPKRERNEDAFIEMDRFFAVCDGMGGHNGGSIASHTVASQLQASIQECLQTRLTLEPLTQSLIDQIQAASAHLWTMSLTHPDLAGMGTTLLSALFDGRFLIHAHVGDSRLYRLRGQTLDLLTLDDTPRTPQGRVTTMEHRLTKALGCEPKVMPTVGYQVVFPKDRFLLCTDGISSYLTTEQITRCLSHISLKEATSSLIQEARGHGSLDDATAVMVQVEFPDAHGI